MITGKRFCRIHRAISQHFKSSKYDAVKNNFKVSGVVYDKAPQNLKMIYDKWGGKMKSDHTAIDICLSNHITDGENWIYNKPLDGVIRTYQEWDKTHTALSHFVGSDLTKMNEFILNGKLKSHEQFFTKTPSGKRAPLLQLYLAKHVLLDTVAAIDVFHTPFLVQWASEYGNDPALTSIIHTMVKYKSFIDKSNERLSNTVTTFFKGA